jgi:hypothetical protein
MAEGGCSRLEISIRKKFRVRSPLFAQISTSKKPRNTSQGMASRIGTRHEIGPAKAYERENNNEVFTEIIDGPSNVIPN